MMTDPEAGQHEGYDPVYHPPFGPVILALVIFALAGYGGAALVLDILNAVFPDAGCPR